MNSRNNQKITAADRQDLKFIEQLHRREPACTAAQLIERLKTYTGRQPSNKVLRATELHVDPYKEAREVIAWKRGL
ncbi:hypothetical protein F5Y06DRAFT_282165 [Hypoxylon sp. FL0890]|nr:hypothetical protein F5Y06DRAFT_282165 [Hypoxylon sp. FL0890]